jgi:cytochrome c551/c552
MHKHHFLLPFTVALTLLAQSACAAPPAAVSLADSQKQRLVLMPLQLAGEERNLQGAMETALAEVLETKYTLFFGERVQQKSKQLLANTSGRGCGATRCVDEIAQAFQSELAAIVSVVRQEDGFILTLNIRDIRDGKSVYSRSLPCRGCDAYQLVEKLKELAGGPEAPKSAAADAETALWLEARRGNKEEDYAAYLGQYPQGKYAPLARNRLERVRQDALAAADRADWNAARNGNDSQAYAEYLALHPQGNYAALAQARMEEASQQETGANPNEMPMAARELNCVACHALDHKVVGPAWRDVAARYRGATQFEYNGNYYALTEGLVMKISKGGADHWGKMPMPANDPMGAKRAKIAGLVNFILRLDSCGKTE